MKKISSDDYCQNFVRKNNYPLYLLHFFIPRPIRQDALALMALHIELITIPEKARDPSMIMIRLKWWHDGVMALLDNRDYFESPLLDALTHALNSSSFDRKNIEDYFSRFEARLQGQPTDTEELFYAMLVSLIPQQYCKNRFAQLLQYHDRLPSDTSLRALRLWLSHITHR
tara:strand:+ start:899 stop:1411 length:513 start_codon:yes stop_codon:yes gene_type:complete